MVYILDVCCGEKSRKITTQSPEMIEYTIGELRPIGDSS